MARRSVAARHGTVFGAWVLFNIVQIEGTSAAEPASSRRSAKILRAPTPEDLRKARTALAEKTQEFQAQSVQLAAERKQSAHLAHEVERLSQKLKTEVNKELFLQQKLSKVRSDLLTDLDVSPSAKAEGLKEGASAMAIMHGTPKRASPPLRKAAPLKPALRGQREAASPRHTDAAYVGSGLVQRSPKPVVAANDDIGSAGAVAAGSIGTEHVKAGNVKTGLGEAGSDAVGSGTAFDRLEEKLHEEDERIQELDSAEGVVGTEGPAATDRAQSAAEGTAELSEESSTPAPADSIPQPSLQSAEPAHQASFVQTPVAISSAAFASSSEAGEASETPAPDAPAVPDATASDATAAEVGSNELIPLEAEDAGPDTLPPDSRGGEGAESNAAQDANNESPGNALSIQAADGVSASGDVKAVLDTTVSSDDEAFLSQMAPGAVSAHSA